MGSLLLIRHGQASALAAVYDRLSPLGEAQARKLGAHWAQRGEIIGRIYCGPRERQKRSAELALEAYRAAGGRAAAPELLEELDEMRIEPLLQEQLQAICARHPMLRDLASEMLSAESDDERGRARARLGATILRLWNQGIIQAAGVESWHEFRARVRRALDQVLRGSPRGARLIAFTSAGVIGAARPAGPRPRPHPGARARAAGPQRQLHPLPLLARRAAPLHALQLQRAPPPGRRPRDGDLPLGEPAWHPGGEPGFISMNTNSKYEIQIQKSDSRFSLLNLASNP